MRMRKHGGGTAGCGTSDRADRGQRQQPDNGSNGLDGSERITSADCGNGDGDEWDPLLLPFAVSVLIRSIRPIRSCAVIRSDPPAADNLSLLPNRSAR